VVHVTPITLFSGCFVIRGLTLASCYCQPACQILCIYVLSLRRKAIENGGWFGVVRGHRPRTVTENKDGLDQVPTNTY